MPDQHGSRNIGAASRDNSHEQGAAPLSLDACVLRHVARVSRAVVSAFDPALAPLGLTGHQFNLMTTLGQMGPMTVGNLADVLGMDASGVPRAIRPLADSGLVGVERGADRRQRVLSLTGPGRALLDRAKPEWLKVQKELVDAVGPTRWSSLMTELRALRRAAAECSTRKGPASAPQVAAAE
jgi:DNA-binding MarR family transcriptional regulator